MEFTQKYIECIEVCDRFLHRQQFKEAFQVLTKIKLAIEFEEDTELDNDFNSRAALCALLYGQSEEALRLTEMVNLNTPGFLLIQALRGWALKEIGYEKRANILFHYVLNSVPDTDSVMDSLGAAISSKLLGNELSYFFFDFTIGKFENLVGNDRKLNLLWIIFAYIKKSELETTPEEKQVTLLKALELTKESSVIYDNLGHTYYAQKKYELALKCYLKSIEIHPNNNFYRHIKVSFIYFFTGREEQAKNFILNFMSLSRDLHIFYWIISPSIEIRKSTTLTDFEKNYKIGLLLYYSQVYQSSYIMLQKAQEFDRYNYKLCIFMCIVQKYLGLLDEAIENLEDLRNNKYPTDIPLMIILAELYTVTLAYDKAEELYLKIIEITPNKSFSLYLYVKFLNKMNKLEQSLTYIQKAIDIEPKKIKLLIMKALIHSSLKQLDKAYETYEEVLRINPNLQSTKYQLSQINFVLNNYQKSFDQMMNIKEGEVGYEKSLNLLIKLFISYPNELTKDQLEYANTKLRDKITQHLKGLGNPPKSKKKPVKKNGQKMDNTLDFQLKDNTMKEADKNEEEEEKTNLQSNIKSSKQKKEVEKLKNKKKVQKNKKSDDIEEDEEEEEIEEKIQDEEEEQEEEEIQLEKEEAKENNEQQNEEQDNENENDDQGNQEEIEINKLLEGQAESLDELDEIDQEINESSSKPEDYYKEYLQKIREENIKDKQEIFQDYCKYYNENQQTYNKLLQQQKKINISTLFEGNDINEILLGDQNNNNDNNENENNNDDAIPIQIEEEDEDNLNINSSEIESQLVNSQNNDPQSDEEEEKKNQDSQEVDQEEQVESEVEEQEKLDKKKKLSKKMSYTTPKKDNKKKKQIEKCNKTGQKDQKAKQNVKKVKKQISKKTRSKNSKIPIQRSVFKKCKNVEKQLQKNQRTEKQSLSKKGKKQDQQDHGFTEDPHKQEQKKTRQRQIQNKDKLKPKKLKNLKPKLRQKNTNKSLLKNTKDKVIQPQGSQVEKRQTRSQSSHSDCKSDEAQIKNSKIKQKQNKRIQQMARFLIKNKKINPNDMMIKKQSIVVRKQPQQKKEVKQETKILQKKIAKQKKNIKKRVLRSSKKKQVKGGNK